MGVAVLDTVSPDGVRVLGRVGPGPRVAEVARAVVPLDWMMLGFAVLMGWWGYARGFTLSVLALTGLVLGALLGSRIAPLVLEGGARSPWAPLGALIGGLVLGALLSSLLPAVGGRLRRGYGARAGVADGLGGALVCGALAFCLVWVLGAVVVQAPLAAGLRGDLQRSRVLRALNEALPPSGPLLGALARVDPFPAIRGPAPGVRAPSSAIVRGAGVRRASSSVVRVLGTACGVRVQGSGWLAGDGLVVTNAHVVAGQSDTVVQGEGEPSHAGDVVWFDPRNDLALLRVAALRGRRGLAIRTAAPVGTAGAVLGFPEDGPYEARPARIGPTSPVISRDGYGRGPVQRVVTAIRGRVRPGNSGGPLVDRRGRVLATIFAAGLGRRERAFGVPDSVVVDALARAGGPVPNGGCSR